jgi:hypothetical protein
MSIVIRKSSVVKGKYDINGHFNDDSIETIKEMMYDKNKCLLYMKSDNGYFRMLSIFLIKKNLKNYNEIRIENLGYIGDKDVFYVRAYNEKETKWDIFS